MKVLVACECSGIVKTAFRERGHDAWSCDLKPSEITNDGHHIEGDIRDVMRTGYPLHWDLLIAHPPCTDLSKAGGAWWKFKGHAQKQALDFVQWLMDLPIEHIAIENPVGKINTAIRSPDQIIHPYYFGDPFLKETCLWLKNLPKLQYVLKDDMFYKATAIEPIANWVKPGNKRKRRFNNVHEGAAGNVVARSRTFQGIANAMASQWGSL